MSYNSQHQHVEEMTDCRNCESTFDQARQHYYDDICPSCKREDPDEKDPNEHVSTVSCSNPECDEEVPHTEAIWKREASAYDQRGESPVCPDCKDYRWRPGRGI